MTKRIFSLLTLSSLMIATSVFAASADEENNEGEFCVFACREESESILSYLDEEEYDVDDEYVFLRYSEIDEDEDYLAADDEEQKELIAQCEGGKCPREMIERLRKEKRDQRKRKRALEGSEYDDDLSDEPPESHC